jgi:dTDP-4-amino-4,6-dideoxygalactose transaminase
MMTDTWPAILGGVPLSDQPLNIVRPRFPGLETFVERFRTALLSGSVTNHGPHVRELERQLALYMHVPAVAACVNGELALMLMLKAAGVDSGEVIVPSYTFSGTPHAVRWCGATPVFADIDPEGSMCLDPIDAERRITERTKAILGVDAYGIACNYETFAQLGNKYGIRILYDSAPAFGTKVDGKPIGRFGDAQIFSFHATKAYTTMEGGCVTSQDERLLERVAALRNFGQVNGPDCDEAGINAKMTEVSALIGLEQLKDFDAVVAQRHRMAQRFRQGLSEIPGLSFATPPPQQTPVWLYFPVVVDPQRFGLNRDVLTQALARENLHVRKYFELPCHHMAAYKDSRHIELPLTEIVAYNVISLPIYNDMTEQECDLFVEGIRRIHEHADQVVSTISREK